MATTRPKHRRSRRRELLTAYGFLLPDALGLLIFVVAPIGYALVISLHEWNALSPMRWTGLDNYRRLLRDPQFWSSLRVTVTYALAYVPLVFGLSLALALLVHRRLPLMPFFRTLFFVPVVLSLVVSSLMWKFILDERVGLLNYLLGLVGLEPRAWLGSVELALPSVILVSVWIQMGYFMVIFLAGLQDIPRMYHDAAAIDGAGPWRTFRHVTFPLLRPTSLFVVVILLIQAFQVFDQIWVITKGGPANATQATVVYIYQQAFQYLNLGYGSALAFALFLVIVGFSALQFRLFRSDA